MKLTTSYLAIASALSTAAATSCTADVAFPWPYSADTTCETAECAQINAEANCMALGSISDSTTCVQKLRMLRRAANLECTSSETCFVYTDKSLLCMVQTTGEYHNDVGGKGNAFSGVYTAPNGDVTTATFSTQPTSSATAKGNDEAPSASVSASTTRASASKTETAAVGVAAQSSGSSSPSSETGTTAHSSATSSSSSVREAPAQQTGGAVSASSVQAALLAFAALPAVVVGL